MSVERGFNNQLIRPKAENQKIDIEDKKQKIDVEDKKPKSDIDLKKQKERQEELSAKILAAMGHVDLSKQIEPKKKENMFNQYFQWSDFTQ